MLTLLASILMARPLVMAHYMPWYESKSYGGEWGWHWTMNHFNPERGELASQFHPLIGPYDSSDPATLECQTLQMKIAGIDGVFIDWYGTKDLYDYTKLNQNTDLMIHACEKAGLKYSIVIEDAIVPGLVKAGKSTADDYATSALDWMRSNWFDMPGYLHSKGQPVLLMFGPQYYKDPDLARLFPGTALVTLLGRRDSAVGGYGWPEPQVGDEKSWDHVDSYYSRAKDWPLSIPVAYPRFEDIYKQAGVHDSWGEIKDRDGSTFQRLFDRATSSGARFVQIATWNDWGEGTQVEPSTEFGYRDLEVIQAAKRSADPAFPFDAADLRMPAQIYALRKQGASGTKLDGCDKALLAGKPRLARQILAGLKTR